MKKRSILPLVFLIALVGLAGWGFRIIRQGFSARDNPSWIEARVARAVRRLSIPASARDARNPFMPTPEVVTDARKHFADHCATCHGNNGSGDTEIGRSLYPKAPDMRLPQTKNLTDGEIYYIIHNGIRLTGMPAWGEAGEKDDDSWKLVLFIRHLPQLTPEEEQEMERLNPKSAAEQTEEEQEERFLNEGKPAQPHGKMHH